MKKVVLILIYISFIICGNLFAKSPISLRFELLNNELSETKIDSLEVVFYDFDKFNNIKNEFKITKSASSANFECNALNEIIYFNAYILIGKSKYLLLNQYFLENNDELVISLDSKNLNFSRASLYTENYNLLKSLKLKFDGLGSQNSELKYSLDSNFYFKSIRLVKNKFYKIDSILELNNLRLKKLIKINFLLSQIVNEQANIIKRIQANPNLEKFRFLYSELEPLIDLKEYNNYRGEIYKYLYYNSVIETKGDFNKTYIKIRNDSTLYDNLAFEYINHQLFNIDSNKVDSLIKSFKNPNILNKVEILLKRVKPQKIDEFIFPDYFNNQISIRDFVDKVVIIDFWFTGCSGCKFLYENEMVKVKEYYKNNSRIKFIAISVDITKEKWKEGLDSGYYTSDQSINLFTNGYGNKHPFLQKYNIKAFPTIILLDKNNILISSSFQELNTFDKIINKVNKLLN